jgi:2-polyprenyl-6-hydroxyphenyl methylase/3-demethylubiquinone-9 3-methyltransferase
MAANTLDPAEIKKFSALAAEWWNPRGPFSALHKINPVRMHYIRDVAARHFDRRGVRPLEGLSVLDLGCGGGLASAPLARLGGQVTGLDASPDAIGAARAYADDAALEIAFRTGTAEELANQNTRFDLVVALEIIEHVADVGAFLEAAAALTAPGGVLIVSTINRTAKARALAIFAAERILKWAPEGAHDHDKLVTPDEIRAHAPALQWDAPVGISYEPLGRGWALSNDVSMNYLMAGYKPR